MPRPVAVLRPAIAVLASLVAAAAVSAAPATAAPARTATMPVTKGRISWHPCKRFDLSGLQCGSLKVPLDHSHPHGATITLALTRRIHTVKASAYQGVMLMNPGGPGGSGLWLPTIAGNLPQSVAGAYDWIGFDPRGVGESRPALTCQKSYGGYGKPAYDVTVAGAEAAWTAKVQAYAKACGAKNSSALLNHLTTVDSARDMDSIRAALGQKKINDYGYSYGTYLGQVYSTLYPTHVRRQVLDSNVNPREVWYQNQIAQDPAFETVINRFFGWIAKYNSTYHLGATRSAVRARYYAIRSALDAKPAKGPHGRLGGTEWNDVFTQAGYNNVWWPDLASVFSNYARTGQTKKLDTAFRELTSYNDDNGTVAYLGVVCTDAAWPTDWSRWRADGTRLAATSPFLGWSNQWFNAPCLTWPAKPHTPVTVTGKGVPATLLIDETLDAATPYEGSLEVRSLFTRSRLLAVVGGVNHAASLGEHNSCVDNVVAAYLGTGKLPARNASDSAADATCRPVASPTPGDGGFLYTEQAKILAGLSPVS